MEMGSKIEVGNAQMLVEKVWIFGGRHHICI